MEFELLKAVLLWHENTNRIIFSTLCKSAKLKRELDEAWDKMLNSKNMMELKQAYKRFHEVAETITQEAKGG